MRYHAFDLSLAWIGHNATRYHDFNMLAHTLLYISFSLAWFWAICNALPRVKFIKFIKNIHIKIFSKKIDGNTW